MLSRPGQSTRSWIANSQWCIFVLFPSILELGSIFGNICFPCPASGRCNLYTDTYFKAASKIRNCSDLDLRSLSLAMSPSSAEGSQRDITTRNIKSSYSSYHVVFPVQWVFTSNDDLLTTFNTWSATFFIWLGTGIITTSNTTCYLCLAALTDRAEQPHKCSDQSLGCQ